MKPEVGSRVAIGSSGDYSRGLLVVESKSGTSQMAEGSNASNSEISIFALIFLFLERRHRIPEWRRTVKILIESFDVTTLLSVRPRLG